MDISLATRKTPKKTQAQIEKPWLKPYQGTSTTAAKNVNENSRILVQIKGAPAAGGDAELGAVRLGGMAVEGSTGWPEKPVKHSTVPCPRGNGGRLCEAAHERLGGAFERPPWMRGPGGPAAMDGRRQGPPTPSSSSACLYPVARRAALRAPAPWTRPSPSRAARRLPCAQLPRRAFLNAVTLKLRPAAPMVLSC